MTFTRNNMPKEENFVRYRKKVLTKACKIIGPFEVETREGMLTCPDGYLAIDAHGWPYPIAKDEFEKIYSLADEAIERIAENDTIPWRTRRALLDVAVERQCQDAAWPNQQYAPNIPWLGILTEEVGEVARATLGNQDAGNLREELVQVAAVAVAWIEWLDDDTP